jgi:hypothetical protein
MGQISKLRMVFQFSQFHETVSPGQTGSNSFSLSIAAGIKIGDN